MEEKEYIITIKDIKAAIAYCAVRQSPEICPRNLEIVIEKVDMYCKDFKDAGNGFIYKNFTSKQLREFVNEVIKNISEIQDWNLSIAQKRKNVTDADLDDPLKVKYLFNDLRHRKINERDFIDLYALSRNVYNLILAEAEV